LGLILGSGDWSHGVVTETKEVDIEDGLEWPYNGSRIGIAAECKICIEEELDY
jgi:hypothetical protein